MSATKSHAGIVDVGQGCPRALSWPPFARESPGRFELVAPGYTLDRLARHYEKVRCVDGLVLEEVVYHALR